MGAQGSSLSVEFCAPGIDRLSILRAYTSNQNDPDQANACILCSCCRRRHQPSAAAVAAAKPSAACPLPSSLALRGFCLLTSWDHSADKLGATQLADCAALQAVVEQRDLVNDHMDASQRHREEMAYHERRVQE